MGELSQATTNATKEQSLACSAKGRSYFIALCICTSRVSSIHPADLF
jgi:hypothetical protein